MTLLLRCYKITFVDFNALFGMASAPICLRRLTPSAGPDSFVSFLCLINWLKCPIKGTTNHSCECVDLVRFSLCQLSTWLDSEGHPGEKTQCRHRPRQTSKIIKRDSLQISSFLYIFKFYLISIAIVFVLEISCWANEIVLSLLEKTR